MSVINTDGYIKVDKPKRGILPTQQQPHTCKNCKWCEVDGLIGECSNDVANRNGVTNPFIDFSCNQWEAR